MTESLYLVLASIVSTRQFRASQTLDLGDVVIYGRSRDKDLRRAP